MILTRKYNIKMVLIKTDNDLISFNQVKGNFLMPIIVNRKSIGCMERFQADIFILMKAFMKKKDEKMGKRMLQGKFVRKIEVF